MSNDHSHGHGEGTPIELPPELANAKGPQPTVEDIAHLKAHMKIYFGVLGALAFLTLVTVWVSYLNFSVAGHITVALIIAAIKAGLVAAFFMHLANEKPTIYRILVMTFIFFMGLLFLSLLSHEDPIRNRNWKQAAAIHSSE